MALERTKTMSGFGRTIAPASTGQRPTVAHPTGRYVRPAPKPFELELGSRLVVRATDGAETACEVISPLGQGANSRTYLARTEAGAHVVLKCTRWIKHTNVDADLLIEERILGPMRCRSLVGFLGGADGPQGRRVLAFERVFPNPLQILARPEVRRCFPDPGTRYVPLPLPLALSLSLDLLRGIGYLHAQGFVHHDVKLGNVMMRVPEEGASVPNNKLLSHALEGRAQAVLIDIGASRSFAYLRDLNSGKVDADARVIAPQLTPLYAPPEALLESPTPAGPRRIYLPSIDLYAAAVVIYAWTSGRLPYEHQGLDTDTWDGLIETKAAERLGRVTPISHLAISGSTGYRLVADELYALLVALMHRDPAKRPKAREACESLQRLITALPRAAMRRAA